jgi:hypothetical protein
MPKVHTRTRRRDDCGNRYNIALRVSLINTPRIQPVVCTRLAEVILAKYSRCWL